MSEKDKDAHDFDVVGVEPALSRKRIAVTLTDVRGGKVTLHLEEAEAAKLRDILARALS